MKYLRPVLVFCLLLCLSSASVQDIHNDLKKFCPFYGFDGVLQCPGESTQYPRNYSEGINPSYVLSGLGYDRVTRQIRFPVLPSATPTAATSSNFQGYHFLDVSSYLNTIFTQQSVYNGGLFVLPDNYVEQFASLFGNYRVNMAVTQKLYNSYTTAVSSKAPIAEFLEILTSLPPNYNPNNQTLVNLYQTMIIDIFGTDVSIASTHGGVFFQQTAIKSCYPGNVPADAEAELQTTIAKLPPPSVAYLDYRSLGVFDVKGGNPEIPHTDYNAIIASFPQDPAITGFNSVPLWTLVPANYQAAVQAATNRYTGAKQAAVNSIINQVNQQKEQSYLAPQNVYVYARQTEQFGDIIYWNDCPFVSVGDNYYTPRCSYNIQTASVNSGANSVFLNTNFENLGIFNYESQRDNSNGTMRMYGTWTPFGSNKDDPTKPNFTVKTRQSDSNIMPQTVGGSAFSSPWTQTGCVSLDYLELNSPADLLYFSACIDCLPIITTTPAQFGLVDSDLSCVCEGFNDQ